VSRLPVAPNRELGQHFLVDENIVRVAGRLAALAAEDFVLEIGPGLGVLTAYLADHVRLVHAVEVDRGLEQHLRERLGGRDNVKLVFADALTFPLGSLGPPPTKLVSNLPYQIATPLVAESLDGLPTVATWCVMVQREVADRFFATPGSRSYGAVSVLVQLTAERTGLHPVARTCFQPPPNVDSALVAFRRIREWGDELRPLKRLVQASFAHRRKTLPNSVELAGVAGREEAVAALAAIGRGSRVRAEGLSPEEFPRLAAALATGARNG
jgi:16S rRNA (adenine1518-N6/adenine1519-N6)-dimethyltransferase